jgi:hypothetical protein
MNYVLFVMFFVSPPANPGKQVWAFNQSAQVEFNSMDACKKFGNHLLQRLNTTTTTTMRGWCANQNTGESTYALHGPPPPPCDDSNKDCYEFPVAPGH